MKSLAVITSTRADYGLLRPVLRRLYERGEVLVTLIVTGSHLSDGTVEEITNDGFVFDSIDIMKYPQNRRGIADITVLTQKLFLDYFSEKHPDGVLLLGDRYEIFSVAVSASFLDIPIFHISGGDVTSGAIDDSLRHCITKLSSVHFPSCERYAERLMCLGEQPSTIFNVGGLGDENIKTMTFMTAEELSSSLNFDLCRPFFLITYHPETLSDKSSMEQVGELLLALSDFKVAMVITGANSDDGGTLINDALSDFCKASPDRLFMKSLGVLRYLSSMGIAKAVIGNSSSGVCETPSFGTPTVNIGNRQKGRLISDNIVCCECSASSITEAIRQVTSDEFIKNSKLSVSPYHKENTSDNIASITARLLNDNISTAKEFYDVK